ncbi:MAG: tonB [Chlorobi bacterium]|nr:tonB [Chlorobiota bacterium]
MKYSHILALCGVLLLAGYARGKSQQQPSVGLKGYRLQRLIIYPKEALKRGLSGMISVKWFPATGKNPAHAVVVPGSSMIFADAVRRGLHAYDGKLAITDSASGDAWMYEVSFQVDSTKGKRVGRIEVFSEIAVATPELESSGISATEHYPAMDEFVTTEKEPTWDAGELQHRITYPEIAQRNNIEGTVIIRILIDSHGRVVNSHVDRSDHPLLTPSALKAVTETVFTPAMHDGKPVAVWVQIPVTFRLSR